jgi:hypothetical protein
MSAETKKMLRSINAADWRNLPGVWRIFSMQSKLRDSFRHSATFGWPMYDLRYYLSNLEPRRLYEQQKNDFPLNLVQQRVVRELQQNGISIVNVNDLFPENVFSRLQELAEALLETTERDETTKEPERVPGTEKFYLVRPLGQKPLLSIQNEFLAYGASDEILRIVCSYFNMFCRLLSLDVWYNLPVEGPDQLSQRWHRDPDDKKQVKIFLYLRDVDGGTGPFCYIPKSHNGGPFAKVLPQTIHVSNYPPDGVVEKLFPPDQRRVCVGKAGTLIFCDTTGYHRGGHAATEPRLLINSVYMTNAATTLLLKRFGKFYSIPDWRSSSLGSLSQYAIRLHTT